MDKNVIATNRADKYLSLLEDESSKSHEVYMDLLETLKKGHVEGKVTMADLLLTAFSQLGYMCKSSGKGLDSKAPEKDKDGNLLIHKGKYNKYAAFFEEHDKAPNAKEFYGGSKQNEDWCAVFVHWCLFNTFGEKNTRLATGIDKNRNHGAGVEYDFHYYMDFPHSLAMFLNHKVTTAGDQAFFYTKNGLSHTGLVVANYGGYVYILEGNTNPQVGTDAKIVPEGKGVCLKRYALDRIDIEFCRPYYKEVAPCPQGFDWADVRKKTFKLYEVLKAELEQKLTPEELVVEEITPEEVEMTRLQIFKNKVNSISHWLKDIGMGTLKNLTADQVYIVKKKLNAILTQLSSINSYSEETIKKGK